MICTQHRGSNLSCAHLSYHPCMQWAFLSDFELSIPSNFLFSSFILDLLHFLLHFFHCLEGSTNTAYFAWKEMDSLDDTHLLTDCSSFWCFSMSCCVWFLVVVVCDWTSVVSLLLMRRMSLANLCSWSSSACLTPWLSLFRFPVSVFVMFKGSDLDISVRNKFPWFSARIVGGGPSSATMSLVNECIARARPSASCCAQLCRMRFSTSSGCDTKWQVPLGVFFVCVVGTWKNACREVATSETWLDKKRAGV